MSKTRIEGDLRRYFQEIKSLFPVFGKEEKMYVALLKVDVDEYVASNPDCDYAQIVSAFGTPKAVMSQRITEMDSGDLLKRVGTAKIIRICMIAVIVAAVVAAAAIVALKYVDYIEGRAEYVDREVTEIIE